MEFKSVNSIPVTVPEKALLHRIGKRRGGKVSKRIEGAVKKAVGDIRRHASPKAVYRYVAIAEVDENVTLEGGVSLKSERLVDALGDCEKTVLFLVTMGDKVDRIIRQNMEAQPHYGFILDATASVAAEGTAQYVQDHIEQGLGGDEGTTLRYSPGYCDWPLKEQKKLFGLLPGETLGVKLSESSLMSPRKSVSAIFGICPADSAGVNGNACRNCARTNCLHRRETAKV